MCANPLTCTHNLLRMAEGDVMSFGVGSSGALGHGTLSLNDSLES